MTQAPGEQRPVKPAAVLIKPLPSPRLPEVTALFLDRVQLLGGSGRGAVLKQHDPGLLRRLRLGRVTLRAGGESIGGADKHKHNRSGLEFFQRAERSESINGLRLSEQSRRLDAG